MFINRKPNQRGYTLVELSISLTIIAVLLSSGLSVFSKTDEARRFRITIERQTQIQNALQTYIYENKHLPCPAIGSALESEVGFGAATNSNTAITFSTISATSADNSFNDSGNHFDGIAAGTIIAVSGFADADNNGYFTVSTKTSTGKIIVSGATELDDDPAGNPVTILTHSCNEVTDETGMVPVKNLKLADEYAYDGWNRKFTYRIAAGMGDSTDFADRKYKGDIGIIDINGNEKTDKDKPAPRDFGAAYVLISHGPNGEGAWAKNATAPMTAPAVTSREKENTNHSVNKSYLQAERTTRTRGTDAGFDDIVVFKRQSDVVPQLKGRSPISISNNACTNARAIIAGGEANVSEANLLGNFKETSASNALIADQIYATAKAVKVLCENQATGCALNPLSVAPSNLQLWLDGNDPYGSGNLPKNGALIPLWVDKSGNGNDASQTDAAWQPTFNYGSINRKSSINFDRKYLTVQAPLLGSITTDVTVFVVHRVDSLVTNVSLLIGRDTYSTINAFHVGAPWGAGAASNQVWFEFGDMQNVGMLQGNWGGAVGSTYVWTYKVSSSLNSMTIYRNGVSIATRPQSSVVGYTATLLDIGARATQPDWLVGQIAEVIVYNSALSDDNRGNIESYLKLKWGLEAEECPDQFKL